MRTRITLHTTGLRAGCLALLCIAALGCTSTSTGSSTAGGPDDTPAATSMLPCIHVKGTPYREGDTGCVEVDPTQWVPKPPPVSVSERCQAEAQRQFPIAGGESSDKMNELIV